MIYGSVCSGIEAATVAWHPLGWRAAFYSEIEKFPRAVLQHHYAHVPLHGDFTTIEAGQYEPIDLLVGGTPCQSFSVAGLRGGLADDRGNLALEFLRLVDRLKPRWVVWENVPGVISDKTGALQAMLDGFDELGYAVDIDILDAQFFGVPQRRRRVFICAERVEHILKAKTLSSALTIAQCLAECSLLSLAALCDQSIPDSENWGFDASKPVLSLKRRMKLFGLGSSCEAVSMLLPNFAALLQSCGCAHGASDSANGKPDTRTSAGTKSPNSVVVGVCQNTELSWKPILGAALATMSECITSTSTNATIDSKIYSCARLTALIASHITQSMDSSPSFWSAASSCLTALEAFTDYARRASSDLFTNPSWVRAWGDFEREADGLCESLGDITVRSFGEIFPLSHSLSGNPPPRRETRERITHDVAQCIGASGRGFERAGETRGQDPIVAVFGGNNTAGPIDIATAQNAHGGSGRMDFESEMFVTHALRAEGFDASEDGTGRGTPLVPVSFDCKAGGNTGFAIGEKAGALRGEGFGGGHTAIAMNLRGRDGGAMPECDDLANIRAASGGSSRSYIASSSVRRLTPLECERLQGFPDDYTLIPTGGKPSADGPRYKALGNSMAVPCMRWIGERIQMVEELTRNQVAA